MLPGQIPASQTVRAPARRSRRLFAVSRLAATVLALNLVAAAFGQGPDVWDGPVELELPATQWARSNSTALGPYTASDLDTVLPATFQDERRPPVPEFRVPQPQVTEPPLIGGSVPTVGSLARPSPLLPGSTPVLLRLRGSWSKYNLTTDLGDLLGKQIVPTGLSLQRRSPIITEPRRHGNRIGRLPTSGSYWVPARLDLDTMVSKIDSRVVQDVDVVKGPYSVLHGPGFSFVTFDLLRSPRYDEFQSWASTSFDYKSNGDQWYGRQNAWAGAENWGVRFGYGHRGGSDYSSGGGQLISSSYQSRDVFLALGADLDERRQIEFHYIRLDQTDVEVPGQVFDIDYLVTDGFELTYTEAWDQLADAARLDAWYNRTRFEGSSTPGTYALLDGLRYQGNTDVDSTSTGFRGQLIWGDEGTARLHAGADLRYINQELNERNRFRSGPTDFDINSPIPRSHSINPGVFAQLEASLGEQASFTAGARLDFVRTDVLENPANTQSAYTGIVGTTELDQTFQFWSAFATLRWQLDDHWTVNAGAAHGQRPPTLTELYAAEPFLFVVQSGLNRVLGDPLLDEETLTQLDLGVSLDSPRQRGFVNGSVGFAQDYITYERYESFGVPGFTPIQFLRYTNTDRAIFAGVDLYLERDVGDWVTAFGTLSYSMGRDLTRDGTFFTERAVTAMTQKTAGIRGADDGQTSLPQEPLPGVAPLESRLGLRIHEPVADPTWTVEFVWRVVDNQNRLALSLAEQETPGFATIDIRGLWQVTDRWLLVAGVENLADRNYFEHFDLRVGNQNSVFQPGANYYFGSELVY